LRLDSAGPNDGDDRSRAGGARRDSSLPHGTTRLYAREGRRPSAKEVAAATEITELETARLLTALSQHNLVILECDGAYDPAALSVHAVRDRAFAYVRAARTHLATIYAVCLLFLRCETGALRSTSVRDLGFSIQRTKDAAKERTYGHKLGNFSACISSVSSRPVAESAHQGDAYTRGFRAIIPNEGIGNQPRLHVRLQASNLKKPISSTPCRENLPGMISSWFSTAPPTIAAATSRFPTIFHCSSCHPTRQSSTRRKIFG
jgi:hypothetical protein